MFYEQRKEDLPPPFYDSGEEYVVKGNHTNHAKKYAQHEDLLEFKQRFYKFVDNDFKHLQIKVARQDGALALILILIGILLAKVLGAF